MIFKYSLPLSRLLFRLLLVSWTPFLKEKIHVFDFIFSFYMFKANLYLNPYCVFKDLAPSLHPVLPYLHSRSTVSSPKHPLGQSFSHLGHSSFPSILLWLYSHPFLKIFFLLSLLSHSHSLTNKLQSDLHTHISAKCVMKKPPVNF